MEYVKENGDKVNVKGLTVTVELGDKTMSKINEIKREISHIAEENDALREYATQLLNFIDSTAHQSWCNRSCPAYRLCVWSTRCMFVDWAMERARELGIETDDG